MTLTSFNFLCFFLVVIILYYAVPKKFQWVLLLLASYAFYIASGLIQVFFIAGSTFITYLSGILMQKRRDRYKGELEAAKGLEKEQRQQLKKKLTSDIKRIQYTTIAIHLLILCLVKYSNFIVQNINKAFSLFGGEGAIPGLNILVPLGISFYTFMAMGYVIDIGRGKYDAERNLGKLALFLSFFPSVVQGPISRFDEVGKRLVEEHKINYENLTRGAQLIMWGFFKKLVIADRIAPLVTGIFTVKMYEKLSGTAFFFGMVAYALQIYCDFCGGIDITRGAAQMLGIELPLNFKRPYFSTSVAEYWRRWHMTLGAWMKEYVFYAIMLSKHISKLGRKVKDKYGQKASKYIPSIVTSFIVFLLMGIWHGSTWSYVAYGLYNAVLISGSMALEPVFEKILKVLHINPENNLWKLFRMVRTFLILSIAKLLVIAPSLKYAIKILGKMCTNINFSFQTELDKYKINLDYKNYIVLGVALLIVLIISIIQEKGIHIRESIGKWNSVFRWLVYFIILIMIMVFGIYGPGYDAANFIYQAY